MKMAAKRKSDLQKDVVQKEAVTKIVRHFKKEDRGQLAQSADRDRPERLTRSMHVLRSKACESLPCDIVKTLENVCV